MGGSAFSSNPYNLYTPRMPPAVYRSTRDRCHAALRQLFVCVATPIEGPDKEDFGDVDVLVSLEKREIFPINAEDQLKRRTEDVMADIIRVLRAEHAITPGSTSANLAIAWPDEESIGRRGDLGPDVESLQPSGGASQKRYIQVDVRVCKDVSQLQWYLFKHAHGDIWNLLGSTIRPFGLTVDEEALWIRVPEIEKVNKKRAKIFLTEDPSEILQFLGLKAYGYWEQPFVSTRAMFEYVASSRLFWVLPLEVIESGDGAGDAASSANKKLLRANDRRRMVSRPIFRQWVDEFLPLCRSTGRRLLAGEAGKGVTKDDVHALVREEALRRWVARDAYEGRLREWTLQVQAEFIWKTAIKGSVPSDLDPAYRGCATGALKKIILQDDESFGIHSPMPLKRPDGTFDLDLVEVFVRENWQAVAAVAWEKQQQRLQGVMTQRDLKQKNQEPCRD